MKRGAVGAARTRAQYQAKSERELRFCLADLWLDDETMRSVFDWDPFSPWGEIQQELL